MGSWQYYTVKMSMRKLAEKVQLANSIYNDKTLDEAIQRVCEVNRVKNDIVTYLIRQPDRFFSSIVVAALHGKPNWYPVTLADDKRFDLIRDDSRLNESFGVLKFNGTEDYFALDGQHRLSAIKLLVDPNSDESGKAPGGFKNEEISVIIVVPGNAEHFDEFRTRYRRLFGNLNRYAKPTDAIANIIMDEDDAFAILTRRLICEHSFFQCKGHQKDSVKVKSIKPKNLKSREPYFTSLETLYAMNITLLNSSSQKGPKWNKAGIKTFCRLRPDDEELDLMFQELIMYWNALLEVLPILRENPLKMRDHSSIEGDGGTQDSFLFWPIGQELMAQLARELMDELQINPESPTPDSIRKSKQCLDTLIWDAHQVPWRNLVLIPDEEIKTIWRIRSEERKGALSVVMRISKWKLELENLDNDEIKKLKKDWSNLLLPALDQITKDKMWQYIQDYVRSI